MNEHPILFSTEMVKAILDSKKTMTRRVIKPQPELIYSVSGDIIQVIHNKEDYIGENNAEANTNITKRQLQGGERWEYLFQNQIQGLWEKGFRGLACISRTRFGTKGIFSCLLVPQQYQGNEVSSPTSVYGFSWDAREGINASTSFRWQSTQQQTRKFAMGDSVRELARQKNKESRESELQKPKFQNGQQGKGTHSVGGKQGDSQQETSSKGIGNEPTLYFRDLPWDLDTRLWVRETWFDLTERDGTRKALYKADFSVDDLTTDCGGDIHNIKWQSSMFMPRWASRITLEITNIRVEKVQEITDDDIEFEGIETPFWGDVAAEDLHLSFIGLWNSINSRCGYSWESNPLVWVIEFKIL